MAGGRPSGHPARGHDPGGPGQPARRGQERAPPAVREPALRHGPGAHPAPGLPGGAPLPSSDHRLHGRPGRRGPGLRQVLPQAALRPGQLRPDHRQRPGDRRRPGPGGEVLRPHPGPRGDPRGPRLHPDHRPGRPGARRGHRDRPRRRRLHRLPGALLRRTRARRRAAGRRRPGSGPGQPPVPFTGRGPPHRRRRRRWRRGHPAVPLHRQPAAGEHARPRERRGRRAGEGHPRGDRQARRRRHRRGTRPRPRRPGTRAPAPHRRPLRARRHHRQLHAAVRRPRARLHLAQRWADITAEEVRAAAARLLVDENMLVVRFDPETGADADASRS